MQKRSSSSIYPVVLIAVVIIAFTGSLYGAFASDIQASLAISMDTLGIILSLSQVGILIAFLCYPFLENRLGCYKTMIFGLFGNTVSYVLIALAGNATAFALAFVLSSILGYPFGTAKSTVAILCNDKKRDQNISGLHLVYSIASIAAGFLVSRIKGPHWNMVYLTFSSLWLVMAFIFLRLLPLARANLSLMRPVAQGQKKPVLSDFSLLQHFPSFCFFFYVGITSAVEGLAVIYPLLFVEHVLSASSQSVGYAMATFFAGMAISRLFLIPLVSKTHHPWRLSACLTTIASLSFLSLSLAPDLSFGFAALFISGLAIGNINPLANILEIHIWPDLVDQSMNLHAISPTICRIVLPLVITAIIASFGERGGIMTLSLFMASALVSFAVSYHFLGKGTGQ